MSEALLARVAAIAEREREKAQGERQRMRAQHPEFAAFVDGIRAAFGLDSVRAITLDGVRYGRAPLWFRRTQQHQPPVPGRD